MKLELAMAYYQKTKGYVKKLPLEETAKSVNPSSTNGFLSIIPRLTQISLERWVWRSCMAILPLTTTFWTVLIPWSEYWCNCARNCTDIAEIFSQVGQAMDSRTRSSCPLFSVEKRSYRPVFFPTSLGQNLHLRQNIKWYTRSPVATQKIFKIVLKWRKINNISPQVI